MNTTRREAPEPLATPMADGVDPNITFKAALTEVETIGDRREKGDLELGDALVAFERAMAAGRLAYQHLRQGDERVARWVVDENGKLAFKPFDEAGTSVFRTTPHAADPRAGNLSRRHKAVFMATGIQKASHNLPGVVNADSVGVGRSRDVDGSEGAVSGA